ncbi:uncharacterized protein LOC119740577 [Patiria miniata]|uniref:Integrase catalytic domain-containing protein n=1 Tax=Patiria miniata TaxID=46514 RepID=A0A914B7R9_PATMI|nr:uncharacterized protein LOC119740577 [Patiria miniata]
MSNRTSSSVHVKAAAKRAELLCRQRLLTKKQELESRHLAVQQARQQEEFRLQRERENFDLQVEIEVSEASISAIEQYEDEFDQKIRFKLPDEIPHPAACASSVLGDRIEAGASEKVSSNEEPNKIENPWSIPQDFQVKVDEVENRMPELTPQVNIGQLHKDCAQLDHHVPEPTTAQRYQPHLQPISDIGELTQLLIKQQVRAALPAQQIETFNGDTLKYTRFVKSFEFGVEDKTTDGRDRLNYLCQYTSGEPNTLVSSCLHYHDAEEGYSKAKELLAKRYGNSHKIAQAVLNKANNWPDIRAEDATGLNKFSIFLSECKNMTSSVSALSELNHTQSIQMLVEKLPYRLRSMWRNKVYEVEEEKKRCIVLDDLVSFVDRHSQILSNPTFGRLRETPHLGKNNIGEKNKRVQVKKEAFGTAVNSHAEKARQKKSCQFCGGNSHHATLECMKFAQLSWKDKSSFCFKHGLCFGCLGVGHTKSSCKQRELSKCSKCPGNHPTVLHNDEKITKTSHPAQNSQTQVTTGCAGVLGAGANLHASGSPRMAIVPVLVKASSSHECIATYAFLDNGCGAVFADSEICRALKVRTRKRSIILKTLNSEEVVDSAIVIDRLQLGGMIEENSFIDLPDVYVKNDIPVSPEDMVTKDDLQEWTHLSHIQLPQLCSPAIPRVTLIIGMNVPAATTPIEVIRGDSGDPYGVKTPVGWVIYGVPGRPKSQLDANYINVLDGLTNLENQYKHYMNLDFNERLGESQDESALSREDMRFLDIVKETTEFQGGHYQMALPLQRPTVRMPDNRSLAEKRAVQLKRKFDKNQEFKEKYVQAMEDTIGKGYVEKVPDSQKFRSDGKVWFIPHHGVYQVQKQKMRVVYDCAAEYGGVSLNRQLLQGPDMTNGLTGVLMRFRQEPVAVKADIEAMFYQVRVRSEDRDLLRFLWWPGGDLSRELEEYRMTVHVFGAASSPSCANYALRRTATDNEQRYRSEVTNAVRKNFYVDDFCKSVPDKEEAKVISREVTDLLAEGGFRLTKWVSNQREVLRSIPREEWSKEVKGLQIDQDVLPPEKTLGVLWCMESDTFGFEINVKVREPTRRGILSIVSSVYDPLGMVSAAIMPAKLLLQDLCRLKLNWDEKIPQEHLHKWNLWLMDLPKLECISVDRCFKPEGFQDPVSVQIHHFADASEKGYGVVSYLRLQNRYGDVHCSFVTSKSRVTPLKQQSIPRLELTAATVAVRVHNSIVRELEIPVDQTFFWTDSMTVIKYICNETTRFKSFVANRLTVIRDSSHPCQWKYVRSEQNPADDCSRGLSIDKFIANRRWFRGPEFLWHAEADWPSTCVTEEPEVDRDPEVKRVMAAVPIENLLSRSNAVKKLIEYYSDWNRLRRAAAWWLRLKRILRKRSKEEFKHDAVNNLTVEEIEEAEVSILRWVQHEAFPHQIKRLQEMNDGPQDLTRESPKQQKVDKLLDQLDPVMHKSLMRVGGRLQAAQLPEEAKHQIILPQRCHVTDLIMQHTHQKIHHQGRNHVLAELRRRYWILKAGVVLKSVLKRCVICKKVQAKLGQQKMANLPANRLLSEKPAFTSTGIDYFGPFNIKQGRNIKKRYGVVFTCSTSRAVHIEIAESLDTSSCINAVRRFIARRGNIKELISDNGTNLVGAHAELKKAMSEWNHETLEKFTTDRGITWKFNPPAASHFGGIWERQIRTIRKILQAMLNEQHMRVCRDEEQLRTLMCEVEYTINSRPLTHASDDPKDLNAITPNDLLLLRPSSLYVAPPGVFSEKDQYAKRRWRQMQYLADLFWKRWSREYLMDLQRRQKWLYPQRNLHPGDVVLVADNQAPRSSWPLGIVEKTYPDKNGLIRSAELLLKDTNQTVDLHKGDLQCSTATISPGTPVSSMQCDLVIADGAAGMHE